MSNARVIVGLAWLLLVVQAACTPPAANKMPEPQAAAAPPINNAAVATVGGGTLAEPAIGPGPAFAIGGAGFVPVKNWDFGRNGTIRTIQEMNAEFQYHDQFNTFCCGGKYGSIIVAPDKENAIAGQRIEDPRHPVREFLDDSLKTYLVPPEGMDVVKASDHAVGCGSFQAKFTLPRAGKLLKQDMIFETRLRYLTGPYFWCAIWTAGNQWNRGAEMDVLETFGFDNGNNYTNYNGRFWHCDPVGGTTTVDYGSWEKAMTARGVLSATRPFFDAAAYHTWTWLYRADDTYSAYMDGIEVQSGMMHWTLSGKEDGEPLNMSFIFDGAWGHSEVASVAKPLAAGELAGKYYEWKYSRIYLRDAAGN